MELLKNFNPTNPKCNRDPKNQNEDSILREILNIATGETSQAINPYHFFNCPKGALQILLCRFCP